VLIRELVELVCALCVVALHVVGAGFLSRELWGEMLYVVSRIELRLIGWGQHFVFDFLPVNAFEPGVVHDFLGI